jgi:hypothetical protein
MPDEYEYTNVNGHAAPSLRCWRSPSRGDALALHAGGQTREGLLLLLAVSARELENLSFNRNRLACPPSQGIEVWALTAGQVDRLQRWSVPQEL